MAPSGVLSKGPYAFKTVTVRLCWTSVVAWVLLISVAETGQLGTLTVGFVVCFLLVCEGTSVLSALRVCRFGHG